MPTKISPMGEQRTSAQADERNRLLRDLEPKTYARLMDELESVELSAKQALWSPNSPIKSIYFPRTCVVSLIVPAGDDKPIEAATVGNEGFLGVPVALGANSTNMMALAQVPGVALRLPTATFRAFMAEEDGLRTAALAYAHTLLEQTAQTVACNRRHELSERCARWLLMTHDRVAERRFSLTQDFLAIMLGVRRASVTVAAGMLQRAGLIRYSRGLVEVLNREGLEAASCECYRLVVQSSARVEATDRS